MIDIQKKLPLIIAGVLALLAVVMAASYLKQREQQLAALRREAVEQQQVQQQEEAKQILVAKDDIARGATIEEDMVVSQEIPVNFIQPRAISSIDRAVGKIAIAPISKGEQILLCKLASSVQDLAGLSGRTPTGKRAITIPVDNISSVGGMIRPSDYVDILGVVPQTVQVGDKEVTQYLTVPLFQKVLVLAVGSVVDSSVEPVRDNKSARTEANDTITIALSPQEATMIAFVQEQGKLRFILRSPVDGEVAPVQPASWDTLFIYLFPDMRKKLEDMAKGAADGAQGTSDTMQEEPQAQVEIYKGSERQVIPLEK